MLLLYGCTLLQSIVGNNVICNLIIWSWVKIANSYFYNNIERVTDYLLLRLKFPSSHQLAARLTHYILTKCPRVQLVV